MSSSNATKRAESDPLWAIATATPAARHIIHSVSRLRRPTTRAAGASLPSLRSTFIVVSVFDMVARAPTCSAPQDTLHRDRPLDSVPLGCELDEARVVLARRDRKSTRLNSSHVEISYAV